MSKKYEITDIRHPDFEWLRQIRALRDIPRYGVKAGDLGGWIESEKNLSQDGDCWVFGNAEVGGNAHVGGDAQVFENAHVGGNAWVGGNVEVFENAHVGGNALVRGDALVRGNAQIFFNLTANMKVETDIWRQSMTEKEYDDMSWDDILNKINVKEWIC